MLGGYCGEPQFGSKVHKTDYFVMPEQLRTTVQEAEILNFGTWELFWGRDNMYKWDGLHLKEGN